jgi:ubiquinone/menaquinone biosynthesis C-methylase UbiE
LHTALSPGSYEFHACPLSNIPLPARSYDVVLAFRVLPHFDRWQELLGELCRLARHAVILDYPDVRSANILYRSLFGAKRAWEGNTRSFRCFRRQEIVSQLAMHGFSQPILRPQFFFPMVAHRALGSATLSKASEFAARVTGLQRVFGSPVIVRAVRKAI